MGEGWSDWYAQDFIVGQFPALDTGASGEVVMGDYTDSGPRSCALEPLDCPVVGADPIALPGAASARLRRLHLRRLRADRRRRRGPRRRRDLGADAVGPADCARAPRRRARS